MVLVPGGVHIDPPKVIAEAVPLLKLQLVRYAAPSMSSAVSSMLLHKQQLVGVQNASGLHCDRLRELHLAERQRTVRLHGDRSIRPDSKCCGVETNTLMVEDCQCCVCRVPYVVDADAPAVLGAKHGCFESVANLQADHVAGLCRCTSWDPSRLSVGTTQATPRSRHRPRQPQRRSDVTGSACSQS